MKVFITALVLTLLTSLSADALCMRNDLPRGEAKFTVQYKIKGSTLTKSYTVLAGQSQCDSERSGYVRVNASITPLGINTGMYLTGRSLGVRKDETVFLVSSEKVPPRICTERSDGTKDCSRLTVKKSITGSN